MSPLTDAERESAERAVYHLNRRRGMPRTKPEPQTDGLFAEPEQQVRQWVPMGQDDCLFTKPAPQSRRLVPVDGWPDHCRASGAR
jgi:hypothetical protein